MLARRLAHHRRARAPAVCAAEGLCAVAGRVALGHRPQRPALRFHTKRTGGSDGLLGVRPPVHLHAAQPEAVSAAELEFELEDMPARALVVQAGADNQMSIGIVTRMKVPLIELSSSQAVAGIFSLRPLQGVLPAAGPSTLGRDD
eukprot:2248669-Prymnesium_polylepis.3